MAHAAFNVIDKPAFAIRRHHRDRLASDVTAVIQHSVTAEDVFAHLDAFHALLAHLTAADRLQCFLKAFVGFKVGLRIPLFFAVNAFVNSNGFFDFLNAVILSDEHNVRREPVKFVLVDFFGPAGRIIVPFGLIRITRH